MSWVMLLVMWLILVPSVLVILVPLIDKLLNTQFLWFFNEVLYYFNFFIGGTQTNYILVIMFLAFFLIV